MLNNYLKCQQKKNLLFNCKILTGRLKGSGCVLAVETFEMLIMLKSEIQVIESDGDVWENSVWSCNTQAHSKESLKDQLYLECYYS